MVQVIKHGNRIGTMVCSCCGCGFSFNVDSDCIKEFTENGDAVKFITCPECGQTLKV